jgi:hypothetical protein
MRILHTKSVVAGAVFTALLSGAVAAQSRPPQLHAVVDLRIDKTLPATNRTAALIVSPSGDLIVATSQPGGAIRAFDSTGRPLPLNVPIGNDRDSEIRWISRIGLMGSTLWVADPGFSQLALIDRAGKVTKSLEYPSWVRPAWADRRKYPVFAGVEPLALYADGSWLVRPSRERSLVSTPDYDKSFNYIMRIAENGSVQKVVARLPRDDRRFEMRFNGPSQSAVVVAPLTIWDVAVDGSRLMVATAVLHGADSASYRVTALSPRGDTIYSKKFAFVPVPITQQTIDSVRSRYNVASRGRSVDEARDEMVKQLPWAYPPIESMVVGRDQTTWIGLRSPGADRTWIVLDGSGATLGVVSLPKGFSPRAAESDRVWGFERDDFHVTALVRYKVQPANGTAKR